MNRPSPLFLGSAIIASSLTYASCNVVKPGQDPHSLAASVPIEKAPRHPGKSPAQAQEQAQAPAQERSRQPENAQTAAGPGAIREKIGAACMASADVANCIAEKDGLAMEMQILLPAAAAQKCAEQSSGLVCWENAFETQLNDDPRLEFYKLVKARCLRELDKCERAGDPDPDDGRR